MIELSIDSLAAGGDGVGRDADGRVTFVARTAPGDRVRAELTCERKAFARATLIDVIEPGPARVEPPCALFTAGECGGCQWQHVSRAAQLAAKSEIVTSALRVVSGDRIAEIEAPTRDYGWRRRARLHWFRRRASERAVVGLFAPGSRHVTEVTECVQLDPGLRPALAAVHDALAPGLHKRGELELLLGHAGEVHVDVSGPCTAAAARELMATGAVAGVRWGRRALGALAIEVEPGVRASAEQFVQASAAGNTALRRLVRDAVGDIGGARVLELFAGAGNFTRDLSAAGATVIAVDTRPGGWGVSPTNDGPARGAPRGGPRGAELDGVSWRRGRAAEIAAKLAEAGERFDAVLLDPPRAGARDCMAAVAAMTDRAVYVSCDPATLARDLALLAGDGFEVQRVWPLDVMPQTAHVEAVAVTTKSTS